MSETKNLIRQSFKELVHSVAKVEIPTLLFLSTEKVIENIPSELRPSDVEVIRSLQKSFELLLNSNEKYDAQLFKTFNYVILSGDLTNWKKAGQIREWPVPIVGTSYVPSPESNESFLKFVNSLEKIENPIDRAIEYLIIATKRQFFHDGNKRTALVCANKILLDNDSGIIVIPEQLRGEYLTLLKEYYENENAKDNLKSFLKQCTFSSKEEQYNQWVALGLINPLQNSHPLGIKNDNLVTKKK